MTKRLCENLDDLSDVINDAINVCDAHDLQPISFTVRNAYVECLVLCDDHETFEKELGAGGFTINREVANGNLIVRANAVGYQVEFIMVVLKYTPSNA